MKIYRVELNRGHEESDGFEFFSNHKEAKKKLNEQGWADPEYKIDIFNIPTKKRELIAFLNTHLAYSDNG